MSTNATVYRKTAAGLAEMQARRLGLPRKTFSLLLAVDGRRSREQLCTSLSAYGDVAAQLDSLEEIGLIEDAEPGTEGVFSFAAPLGRSREARPPGPLAHPDADRADLDPVTAFGPTVGRSGAFAGPGADADLSPDTRTIFDPPAAEEEFRLVREGGAGLADPDDGPDAEAGGSGGPPTILGPATMAWAVNNDSLAHAHPGGDSTWDDRGVEPGSGLPTPESRLFQAGNWPSSANRGDLGTAAPVWPRSAGGPEPGGEAGHDADAGRGPGPGAPAPSTGSRPGPVGPAFPPVPRMPGTGPAAIAAAGLGPVASRPAAALAGAPAFGATPALATAVGLPDLPPVTGRTAAFPPGQTGGQGHPVLPPHPQAAQLPQIPQIPQIPLIPQAVIPPGPAAPLPRLHVPAIAPLPPWAQPKALPPVVPVDDNDGLVDRARTYPAAINLIDIRSYLGHSSVRIDPLANVRDAMTYLLSRHLDLENYELLHAIESMQTREELLRLLPYYLVDIDKRLPQVDYRSHLEKLAQLTHIPTGELLALMTRRPGAEGRS